MPGLLEQKNRHHSSPARRPLRILHVGEAPYLSTGYATYANEVLSRLHNTGKYEIAQLACYDDLGDPRRSKIPWTLFSNTPNSNEHEAYNSDLTNQFGKFRFNEVCLAFRPDVVFSITDPWMHAYQDTSVFRRFYKWIPMATVDSTPLQEQWISTYINADKVFAYTDWGADRLRIESGGLINVAGTASPGVDTEVFSPKNRIEARASLGIDPDIFLVGMVARNQARKLFPNLIADFARFLQEAPEEISSRAYLYLHTSYPDKGWDIPRLIKLSGISHRIILTYKCRQCNAIIPSLYRDVEAHCPNCSQKSLALPNVKFGVDRATLATILNTLDVFVQYASNEGFGMPMIEAASCGVPVMATDYSAMSDVVRKLSGYPLSCSLQMEVSSGCYRAIPHGNHFVQRLIEFFTQTQEKRDLGGQQSRDGVLRHYTWEKACDAWMDAFDEIVPSNWDQPQQIFIPATKIPKEFLDNESLVAWCLRNLLGRPDLIGTFFASRLIRDLNWGVRLDDNSGLYGNEQCMLGNKDTFVEFNSGVLIKELLEMRDEMNYWENRRVSRDRH